MDSGSSGANETATTRDVVVEYLERVRTGEGWEEFLPEDFQFTNYAHPVKRADGKSGLEGIRRFYGMVSAMEIKRIIVEGNHARALLRYELQSPAGASFESHNAEVFEVSEGKIRSFGIYFDGAPYSEPTSSSS
jgi:hypothetical protein